MPEVKKYIRLHAAPASLRDANLLVKRWHRRLPYTPKVHFFSIMAITDDGEPVGIAIIGPPTNQNFSRYEICELSRLATNGAPNTSSFLYGKAAATAKAAGYQEIITYTAIDELGTALKAAGWQPIAQTTYKPQNRPNRHQGEPINKIRWHRILNKRPQRPVMLNEKDEQLPLIE